MHPGVASWDYSFLTARLQILSHLINSFCSLSAGVGGWSGAACAYCDKLRETK